MKNKSGLDIFRLHRKFKEGIVTENHFREELSKVYENILHSGIDPTSKKYQAMQDYSNEYSWNLRKAIKNASKIRDRQLKTITRMTKDIERQIKLARAGKFELGQNENGNDLQDLENKINESDAEVRNKSEYLTEMKILHDLVANIPILWSASFLGIKASAFSTYLLRLVFYTIAFLISHLLGIGEKILEHIVHNELAAEGISFFIDVSIAELFISKTELLAKSNLYKMILRLVYVLATKLGKIESQYEFIYSRHSDFRANMKQFER